MAETICIVGLGYVGLPLAVAFSKHFPVIGFDVNEKKIEELKIAVDHSQCISSEEISNTQIHFTSNPVDLKKATVIIVAVPTPVDEAKHPDLSYLQNASKIIGKNLQKGTLVIYESTVYPGVTEDICLPILEKESGLQLGEFDLGYSPERINPGDDQHRLDNVTKIVSGHNSACLERVAQLYETIVTAGVYRAPNIKVAEAAKITENIQRDTNIALMNELSMIYHKLGIDTQEVLDAAGTKWNFHKYFPGLVGGHCFDKTTIVFLKEQGKQKIMPLGQYVDSLQCKKKILNSTEVFYPKNSAALSYDAVNKITLFKPITAASKRTSHDLLSFHCAYNYYLTVTDRHPVIIDENGELKIKLAKDILTGESIVLNKSLPSTRRELSIDILQYLDKEMYRKIRVKVRGRKIKEFKETINKYLNGKKANYYMWDYLPLEKYLLLEKKLKINKKDVYLCTGRGPGLKKFPRIFNINNDILRLIGYYLSEGCITNDTTLRTRFTFHKKEEEYIHDVTSILQKAGIDYSIYHDKMYKSTTIKVSSYLFGFVLRDILKTGTNCYTMQIPELFFDFNKNSKEEILKGLFRGDGGVTWYYGDRAYKKNGKRFIHKNNSIEISYFTASPVLFQQVMLFLLNQNILPKLAKRKGYLSITGPDDVKRLEEWFSGEKKEKIKQYLQKIQKKVIYKRAKKYKEYITIQVESIEKKKTDYVYSIEVDETHTAITSHGIIAHNCIGVDPYYLAFQATQKGYHPKLILSGREINDYMAKHIAELCIKELNKKGRVLKDSTVLLLGLTFKENVTDFRNSRAKDVVQYLKEYGIKVLACEPYMKETNIKEHYAVEPVTFSAIPACDAIIVINKHKEFCSLQLKDLQCSILIDIKHLFSQKEAEEKGITYITL